MNRELTSTEQKRGGLRSDQFSVQVVAQRVTDANRRPWKAGAQCLATVRAASYCATTSGMLARL